MSTPADQLSHDLPVLKTDEDDTVSKTLSVVCPTLSPVPNTCMSMSVPDVRSRVRGYENDLKDDVRTVGVTMDTLPYKFDSMPPEFKRACIRIVADCERELAKFRASLEIRQLTRTVEDNRVVEMDIVDFSIVTPTVEELKAAFKMHERVLVNHPAPEPQDIFSEDNTIPNKAWSQLYVVFRKEEEAIKAIAMGPLPVRIMNDKLISVIFRSALSLEERKDWATINSTTDRLSTVQKQLTDLRAVETNDPYPFSVQLSPLLVVSANEDYRVQLERAKERFKAGDGSALSLLDKKPIHHFEQEEEQAQILNKERIELIFALREFQAKGYRFNIDINI